VSGRRDTVSIAAGTWRSIVLEEQQMTERVNGIHHITAISGDPQKNVDFYAGLLGLRLVKKTVNFDDPGTYHLYFGDEQGRPGTVMTFFAWPGETTPRGTAGTGQVTAVAFAVTPGSLPFWEDHLGESGVTTDPPFTRFDERVLRLRDPDGLLLELVATNGEGRPGWAHGPVPAEQAIRGIHSASLAVAEAGTTAAVLREYLGFYSVAEENHRFRLAAGEGGGGAWVDLVTVPRQQRGRMGRGCVHHIAWRTADEVSQARLQEELLKRDLPISPVRDRNYFRSIYFREPGNILFEVATDTPGFTADEDPARLGRELKLPAWLEARRPEITAALPEIHLPA
jgi:glyoxalase family protein